MNRGWDFARCARHATVGDEGHFLTAILQHAEGWREFVQFGHAEGFRALETHDGDKILIVEFSVFKSFLHCSLAFKNFGGCVDDAVFRLHRRGFNHATTEVALQKFQAAIGCKRVCDGANDGFV